MLKKTSILCCLGIIFLLLMKTMAQESEGRKIGSSKIDLQVSAGRISENGKTILKMTYTVKNLTAEKLFLFNVAEPYIFPKENNVVEVGQYDSPIPPGSPGPYIFRDKVSVMVIKPQKILTKDLSFSYPISILFPETEQLKAAVNAGMNSLDGKQTVTPDKIQLCLGIASPSKISHKGKTSKGVYSASAFEIGNRETVCSQIIQLK